MTQVETLSVNAHENTTATAAQAPILLTFASETSVDSDTFAEKMVEMGGQGTVAKGSYVLRLTTLAGGESTLWPLDLKVTLSADAVKE